MPKGRCRRESRPPAPGRPAPGPVWSAWWPLPGRPESCAPAARRGRSRLARPVTVAGDSRPSKKNQLDAIGAVDHVKIGQDHTLVDDHHTGADARVRLRPCHPGSCCRRRRAPPKDGRPRRPWPQPKAVLRFPAYAERRRRCPFASAGVCAGRSAKVRLMSSNAARTPRAARSARGKRRQACLGGCGADTGAGNPADGASGCAWVERL